MSSTYRHGPASAASDSEIFSRLDQEFDSDDDQVIDADYTSSKLQKRDRTLLEEEEEREKLLALEGSGNGRRKSKKRNARARKKKLQENNDEAGEFMYEMEEGGGREDTSSLASTSSAELDRLKFEYSSTSKVRGLPSLT